MATNFRVEFVRLRDRNSSNIQNAYDLPSQAPVQKLLTGTALTGAGRITCPANVNGFTKYHVRIVATVECLVSFAPAGDAGTSYDAAIALPQAFQIPANTPTLIPVSAGMLISAATGLTFA